MSQGTPHCSRASWLHLHLICGFIAFSRFVPPSPAPRPRAPPPRQGKLGGGGGVRGEGGGGGTRRGGGAAGGRGSTTC